MPDRTGHASLTSLHPGGVKGATERIRLAPVTLITGGNTSGKSTVREAIELLVLGYSTGRYVPKTADGALWLGGDRIAPEGTWETPDGDVTVQREWQRIYHDEGKKAGTVTAETDVHTSLSDARGKRARAQAVRDYFGDEVLLDLSRLLELSDAKRRAFLFGIGGHRVAEKWSAARVRDALPEAHRPIVDTWKPADTQVLDWVYERATAYYEEALELRRAIDAKTKAEDEIRAGLEAPDPQVFGDLRKRLEALRTAGREAARARGERVEQARGAAEDAAVAKAKIERARRDVERVRQQLADVRASAAAGSDNADALERLQTRLRTLEHGSGWGDAATPGIDTLREIAERLKFEADAPPDETAVQAAQEEVYARQREVDAAKERLETLNEAVSQARLTAGTADAEHEGIERSVSLLEKVIAGTSWGEPLCPTCGQTANAKVLDALRVRLGTAARVKEEAGGKLDLVRKVRGEQEKIVGSPSGPLPVSSPMYNRARGLHLLLEQAKDVLSDAKTARDASGKTARDAYTAADDAVRDRLREIDDVRGELAAVERAEPEQDPRIPKLEERLRTLEELAEQLPPDVTGLQHVLSATEARGREEETAHKETVAPLAAEHDAMAQANAKLEEAERIHLARLETEKKHEVANGRAEAFGANGLLGKVVADLLAPLTKAVNATIGDLQLGRFGVRLADERGRPVMQPGVWRGEEGAESFVNLATMSGSETAVATQAGMSVGLARLTDAPWRPVVVDRIEQLDFRRRRAFLRKLVELQAAGEIDQAILMGCPDRVETVPGVEHVDLGEGGWEE